MIELQNLMSDVPPHSLFGSYLKLFGSVRASLVVNVPANFQLSCMIRFSLNDVFSIVCDSSVARMVHSQLLVWFPRSYRMVPSQLLVMFLGTPFVVGTKTNQPYAIQCNGIHLASHLRGLGIFRRV
jgi:hypothetical protein